jgi:cytochrome c oxidase cbb3-type subunit I/II
MAPNGTANPAPSSPGASAAVRLEQWSYDDATPRAFAFATVLWGIVGMLVGVLAATELAFPRVGAGVPFLAFGRIRPLHTNAVIFAFAGNAVFAAIYYSTQRLCKARMWSDLLSKLHFWGWQAIIVAAAITLPLGITQGKEYAELEWPIDLAIAVVWVAFAINYFGTLAKRRERHLYVALWFYSATVVTIAVLHIFNNLSVPAAAWKSYSLYAGVQDALMQWWYGHNAVGFLLTTPFLGLMYYFMPKAAERPVFSYRLSIIHFWSLVFIYIWAGPHHLHYTALPEWASTLGMLFSVMLWMPSWGGMLNGLLTLRGAWQRVSVDPVLKFFVVGVTFYGMATFEGPLLSVKAVNALSHYTDWTIAHVHSGALGWVGFMTFGMLYWMVPRVCQTELWSKRAATAHFWIATVGMVLYIVPIYVAGITQGTMWRSIDDAGRLTYPDFVETLAAVIPMYMVRVVGGTLYLAGAVIAFVNLLATWAQRPAKYEVVVHQAPPLLPSYVDPPLPESRLRGMPVVALAHKLDVWFQAAWHRRWERLPLRFTLYVTLAVVVASLFEIVPTFLIRSNVPTIAQVKPYTPLEVAGRDVYIGEGCYNCHSQMIRPILAETKRYGEFSKPGEFVYDHPFQWGSRRIGPDLAREGGRQSSVWHVLHLQNPRQINDRSIMPEYPWLLTQNLDFGQVPARLRALSRVGVPYDEATIAGGADLARKQAAEVAKQIVDQKGPAGLESKQVVAVVAYLQRLGKDLYAAPPAPAVASAAPPPAAPVPATEGGKP